MSKIKISNESLPARLYANDVKHIKRKVRDEGSDDTRFKDKTAAVRHYVHIGIITEKRLEGANTLDDRIIKSSQKEVVTETLLPVKNSIDQLISVMENFRDNQNEHFKEQNRLTDILIRRIEGLNEIIDDKMNSLLREFLTFGKVSEESLKNIIVLRSIQYVFLLGMKTGKIDSNDRIPWEQLVTFAHRKAEELSVEELQHLTTGNLDFRVVEELAKELFTYIKKLKPHINVI